MASLVAGDPGAGKEGAPAQRKELRDMSQKADYNGYTIRSSPFQKRDSMQWMLSIAIDRKKNGEMTVREFSADNTYETEADADLHGIAFGQSIIDGKIPGLSVD